MFKLKAMLKEIRVFSCIEKQRLAQCKSDRNLIKKSFLEEDGLPKLLSYKLSLDGGELLMNDAGKSLDKWYRMGFSRAHRMKFTCEMLRQVVRALNKLHDLGFSHGDIKPENICAKYNDKGELIFTLIDFGVSLRLFKYGQQ